MVLSLILLVSLGINVLLFVYSRNVAQRLVLISQEIDDLRVAAASFATHVKSVYEMEMFYGDQTLHSLVEHTKDVVTELEVYRHKYSLDGQPLLEEEETQEE